MMTKTKKPGKQRKMLYQAANHRRGRQMAAPLSSELKDRYKTNTATVRRGDTVRIARGDRRRLEGRVTRVDRKSYRIFVDGVTRDKADGTTITIPVHPSKVMITRLNLDDRWRRKALERKGAVEEEAEEVTPPQEKLDEEEADVAEQSSETKAGGT